MVRSGGVGFAIGAIFGLYFIVKALGLFTFPAFLISADKWIVLVSALLLAVSGIYVHKASRNSMSNFANKLGIFGIIVYLIFALYLANVSLNFIPAITSAVSGVAKWINLIVGVLLAVGGISFWSQNRY